MTLLAEQAPVLFDEVIQAIALPTQPNPLKLDPATVTLPAGSPGYAAIANLPFLSQTLTGYSG